MSSAGRLIRLNFEAPNRAQRTNAELATPFPFNDHPKVCFSSIDHFRSEPYSRLLAHFSYF
jgi:hypothetical protein